MVNLNNSDLIMAKLIKLYIIKNPDCTSKQMVSFFNENDFGLMKNYSSRQIGVLIKNSNKNYKWFNVSIKVGRGGVSKYRNIQ